MSYTIACLRLLHELPFTDCSFVPRSLAFLTASLIVIYGLFLRATIVGIPILFHEFFLRVLFLRAFIFSVMDLQGNILCVPSHILSREVM